MRTKIETVDDVQKTMVDFDIRIARVHLFGVCRGCVRKYADGYLILIEESLSDEVAELAVKHELYHIILGHLDNTEMTEQAKEDQVNGILNKYLKTKNNRLCGKSGDRCG